MHDVQGRLRKHFGDDMLRMRHTRLRESGEFRLSRHNFERDSGMLFTMTINQVNALPRTSVSRKYQCRLLIEC